MKISLLLVLLLSCQMLIAQDQTVGLFQNDSLAYNGYTLLFPNVSKKTWLLDNCGFVVHEWESEYNPGLVAYLMENGDLLRTARINSTFNGGGSAGRIERFNWEGDLIWSYNHSSEDFHHHHDIEYLPNGNILIIAWERHTVDDAIANGRNPQNLNPNGLWAEQIVEIKPMGSIGGEIVWEWHLWDHLVQEFDSTKANYHALIEDHPELMHLNFGSNGIDWIHFNSIDYNAELDQIILSSRHLSEVWIIDHSTTIAEAASHQGGNSGKGGDILYRYGNPIVYNRGTPEHRVLFGQHDAQWIESGMIDEGKIMVFNNGVNRPEGNFSTIDVWESPLDNEGIYQLNDNESYGPDEFSWSYSELPTNQFYSSNISGVQRLPNGNTLICEGRQGRIFEVDYQKNKVWNYINPVNGLGNIAQGDDVSNNNVFRAYRYGADYSAFVNHELTPTVPLELNPIDYGCEIFDGTVSANEQSVILENVQVVANPFNTEITIANNTQDVIVFEITDLTGKLVLFGKSANQLIVKNVAQLNAGIYLIRFSNEERSKFWVEKIVRQ